MKKSVTLDDFLTEHRGELDRFESFWRRSHEKDPESFPMESGEHNAGMWLEQLLMFIGGSGKELEEHVEQGRRHSGEPSP